MSAKWPAAEAGFCVGPSNVMPLQWFRRLLGYVPFTSWGDRSRTMMRPRKEYEYRSFFDEIHSQHWQRVHLVQFSLTAGINQRSYASHCGGGF